MAQGIAVHHHIDRLAADLAAIPSRAAKELSGVVREGIRTGNGLAKDFAKETSGRHARKYPGTFSSAMNKPAFLFGSSIYRGEYGPESRGQGKLAPILENGSRNNKAHLNLARSADIIGPAFAKEVGDVIDGLFD